MLLAALWLCWSGPLAWADCGFQSTLPEIAIRRVVDGDTLVREDGARLRLASVNTPELASGGGVAQALAFEARKQVEAFVEQGEHFYWRSAPGKTDRYGRQLGELYSQAGESLSRQLLRRGLGFYVAVAPVPEWWPCLYRAENTARQKQLGVWRHPDYQPIPASTVTVGDGGFQRLYGRVEDIDRGGQWVWVELDGPVVLRLSAEAYRASQLAVGQTVEVSGWLIDRRTSRAHRQGHKRWLLQVTHPSVLRPAGEQAPALE